MVSLLSDDDPGIVSKVSKVITGKGLYGILLLNSRGFTMRKLPPEDTARQIIFNIIYSELNSELSLGKFNIERILYLLSLYEVDFYPFVEITDYLNQLTSRVETKLSGEKSLFRKLDVINDVFFGEEKYVGNTDDYYNIDNSLISEVIRTKKGIPLSLSVVYMALASRLNTPMEGLAFPGHFMCRFEHSHFSGVIDVFNGGRLMSNNEAHWFLASIGHNLDVGRFPAAQKNDIVLRTLKNMENVYNREEKQYKMNEMDQLTKLVEKYV